MMAELVLLLAQNSGIMIMRKNVEVRVNVDLQVFEKMLGLLTSVVPQLYMIILCGKITSFLASIHFLVGGDDV